MIQPAQICTLLKEDPYFAETETEKMMPACRKAAQWLSAHIKDGADENGILACKTAAAMARFYVFVSNIGNMESYGSFKVGDMTVSRDLQREYQIEKELRDSALCEAAEILKDGGFYFAAN